MSDEPREVAVGVGSNVGPRGAHLVRGVSAVAALADAVRVSGVYRSEPAEGVGGGRFLNLCCAGVTRLGPRPALSRLMEAEQSAGRSREGDGKGPRRLDLDLLFYGDLQLEEPDLCLPHPRMHLRPFVLLPLAEIAPDWRHPGLDRTVSELTSRVSEAGVEPFGDPELERRLQVAARGSAEAGA